MSGPAATETRRASSDPSGLGEAARALRIALTAIAAILLSMWLEFAAPHWAGWTVLSVTLATRAASLRKSLWRAGSTVVGVAVAAAVVANFAQATLAFDVAIALWLGLLTAASTIESGQRSYGFALMGFTVPIVAYADVQHPVEIFTTGLDRVSTIMLGIACAFASNVLVAPGVPAVRLALADRLQTAADACGTWLAAASGGAEHRGPVPSAQVTALSEAVVDAFTEQPSLRSGGRVLHEAAPRLRRALAAGLLRSRLPEELGSRSAILLDGSPLRADRQVARVRVAARLLRRGGRLGRRHAPMRARLLLWNDRDWDGRHALDNSLRTMAALSLVNAFWYVTEWSSGSTAATWAALLAILLASHLDPTAEARAFFVGTVLASVVGLVVRYTLLTTTGDFPVLAAVLLPVCMLAALGRADPRATYGTGFGFLILGIIDPTNVMTYDLAASLNQALAELIGIGVAVIAFSALPPPAAAAELRRRARRRLLRSVHGVALDPGFMLPPPDRYLARNFGRLTLIAEDAGALADGQALLLIGLLLLALRRADDRLGRAVGRLAWTALAAGPEGRARAGADLDDLARGAGADPLAPERIAALATLLRGLEPSGWPGLPSRVRA